MFINLKIEMLKAGVTGKNISENLGTSFYRYGEALLLKLVEACK